MPIAGHRPHQLISHTSLSSSPLLSLLPSPTNSLPPACPPFHLRFSIRLDHLHTCLQSRSVPSKFTSVMPAVGASGTIYNQPPSCSQHNVLGAQRIATARRPTFWRSMKARTVRDAGWPSPQQSDLARSAAPLVSQINSPIYVHTGLLASHDSQAEALYWHGLLLAIMRRLARCSKHSQDARAEHTSPESWNHVALFHTVVH
ncbi:hypothetical protein C8Q80DRAFT_949780 [Daedaleopsis nitida]|nr:hypothetical protein C8Q80DRAFT_949780 [Daedaleopsis nitida]